MGAGGKRNQQRHVVGRRTRLGEHAQLCVAGEQRPRCGQGRESQLEVIVHVSNGYDNALFRWNFDGLRANGARWDIIGMSLYPEPGNWQTSLSQAITNMNDMRSRYGKGVMIVEVGMYWDKATASKAFLTEIIAGHGMPAGSVCSIGNHRPTTGRAAAREPETRMAGPRSRSTHYRGSPQPQRRQCHAAGKSDGLLRRPRHHRQQSRRLHGSRLREYEQRANAGVRWRVNATAAGNFTLQWRFANGTTGNRPGSLRVNGTTLSTVALPATGAWTTWTNSGICHGGVASWRQ